MELDNFDEVDELEDDLDRLREKSERTSAAYSEFDDIDTDGNAMTRFLNRFTPIQRLILIALLLIDIVVIGFVLFVITGVISLG